MMAKGTMMRVSCVHAGKHLPLEDSSYNEDILLQVLFFIVASSAVTPLADVLQGTRKNVINVHTSYYESFFLLSVDVWVDGCPLQLEGCNQSNLGLHSPIDNITIPFKVNTYVLMYSIQ